MVAPEYSQAINNEIGGRDTSRPCTERPALIRALHLKAGVDNFQEVSQGKLDFKGIQPGKKKIPRPPFLQASVQSHSHKTRDWLVSFSNRSSLALLKTHVTRNECTGRGCVRAAWWVGSQVDHPIISFRPN